MINKLFVTVVAAALVSACSMAPRYQRPAAPIDLAYPGSPDGFTDRESDDARAADIGWQEFFADARLQALMRSALQNNRDLRIAVMRIEEARSLYNIQSADRLPTLNATGAYSRSRSSSALAAPGQAQVGEVYQVGLGMAAYELDFFGRVRSLSDAALAHYLATEEARRVAQIGLIAEVARAYIAEQAAAEQLELAKQTLKARQESYALAKQRFEVGASSALDLRQAETLLESNNVAVASLSRQRAQAANALVLLVGQSESGLPPASNLSAQTIRTDLAVGLPSDLLTQRPDIRQAEQQLIAANANIGAARAAFFPRIALTSSIGAASSDLSNLFDSASRTWLFSPQLLLPIFDWGRNSANLRLSEVRKNIAIAQYERSIQSAFREVADVLAARSTLEEQLHAQQRLRDATAERLKLAELRYRSGIASYLEVLDAQRELFAADQSLVQARQLRLTNAIDLYRALGGGLRTAGIAPASEALAGTAPNHP